MNEVPGRRIVASGYNPVTDEMWYRFETGEVRCLDAVDRGKNSNFTVMPTPDWILSHGRVVVE